MRRITLLARGLGRPVRAGWALFGGAHFILNVMAAVVAICGVLLLWWGVVEPVVPLTRSTLLRVAPEDRIIDRDESPLLTTTRRLCLRQAGWGSVTRYWVDGVEYKQPPTPPLFFRAGCNDRIETLPVPSTLPPGRYLYRASITFCNKLRCEDAWLTEIPVIIKGRFPIEPTGPAAPLDGQR